MTARLFHYSSGKTIAALSVGIHRLKLSLTAATHRFGMNVKSHGLAGRVSEGGYATQVTHMPGTSAEVRKAYNEWVHQYDTNANSTRDLNAKDYGTKPPRHVIRSRCHCERSEAIFVFGRDCFGVCDSSQ